MGVEAEQYHRLLVGLTKSWTAVIAVLDSVRSQRIIVSAKIVAKTFRGTATSAILNITCRT